MARRTRHRELDVLPRREELEALAHYYNHLKNEHERRRAGSAVKRELEDEVQQVRARFESVLEKWVPDPDLRDAWRAYLHHRQAEPDGPPAIERLVFQGRSEAGSIAEVRGRGDELAVRVDGTLVARVAAQKDFAATTPGILFRLDDILFDETFGASTDAVDALATFVADRGAPPWDHASDLLADGLIDVHFSVTPRGRRSARAAA